MSDSIDQNALYPIREVARLTGINPITLRAWERRYNLIEPVRTESGHRLYTQEHIDFLHETLRLMEEAETVLIRFSPFIPLATPLRWSVASPRLTGLRPNSRGQHPLNRLLAPPK